MHADMPQWLGLRGRPEAGEGSKRAFATAGLHRRSGRRRTMLKGSFDPAVIVERPLRPAVFRMEDAYEDRQFNVFANTKVVSVRLPIVHGHD